MQKRIGEANDHEIFIRLIVLRELRLFFRLYGAEMANYIGVE